MDETTAPSSEKYCYIVYNYLNYLLTFYFFYNRAILVGLHTCGNLSCSLIDLFCNNDCISGLIFVGCCYSIFKFILYYKNDNLIN